jgi:4-hydroxythreonine-4-phosphate dehydrogenase
MKRVAITPGDPLGVGAELAVRAWQHTRESAGLALTLIGPDALWERAAQLLGVSAADLPTLPVDPQADPRWGGLPGIGEVATAVRGCLDGRFDAVCTGPLHKASLLEPGFPYMGHTPYLAALCGLPSEQAVMVFAGGKLTVSLATVHMPLSQVPAALSEEGIVRAARGAAWVVRRGWGIARPRIAVCGLNPHAGERGRLGHEDEQVVAPAVRRLVDEGYDASGPWPGDTIFARAARGDFDLVVAAYHDQGLVAVKTLDSGRSVNITAGLPIIRTSVDHGTARDIAWTGVADPASTIAAVQMAVRLSAQPEESAPGVEELLHGGAVDGVEAGAEGPGVAGAAAIVAGEVTTLQQPG